MNRYRILFTDKRFIWKIVRSYSRFGSNCILQLFPRAWRYPSCAVYGSLKVFYKYCFFVCYKIQLFFFFFLKKETLYFVTSCEKFNDQCFIKFKCCSRDNRGNRIVEIRWPDDVIKSAGRNWHWKQLWHRTVCHKCLKILETDPHSVLGD